jgi:hypothetical protein
MVEYRFVSGSVSERLYASLSSCSGDLLACFCVLVDEERRLLGKSSADPAFFVRAFELSRKLGDVEYNLAVYGEWIVLDLFGPPVKVVG